MQFTTLDIENVMATLRDDGRDTHDDHGKDGNEKTGIFDLDVVVDVDCTPCLVDVISISSTHKLPSFALRDGD